MPLQLVARIEPKIKAKAEIIASVKAKALISSYRNLSTVVVDPTKINVIVDRDYVPRVLFKPEKCLHSHFADVAIIIPKYTTVPADTSHSHIADESLIYVRHEIVAANASHSHIADEPALTVKYNLNPNKASHTHTADSPIISLPAYSPEVQAVLDRMVSLSQKEIDAIETLVDGLVISGDWNNVYDLWAFALNGSDYLTGFKREIFTIGQDISHIPGIGVSSTTTNGYLVLSANPEDLRAWNGTGTSMGGWCLSGIDPGSNCDYSGSASGAGTGDWYFRNRASDVQALLGSLGTTPRLGSVPRPLTDFYFARAENGERYIRVGDATISGANTLEATWRSDPIHFLGRNSNGNQNSFISTHDFWFIGNENLNDTNMKAALEQFRLDLA